jgi:riboflavin kinase / FMN adenylyltransferase
MRYKSKVIKGNQEGRKIGFPTLNLEINEKFEFEKGVHASFVYIENKPYQGLLYFGPRLVRNETFDVLEIYVLEFMDEIYNSEVEFETIAFIRGIMDFNSMEEMKKQIEKDLSDANKIFSALKN